MEEEKQSKVFGFLVDKDVKETMEKLLEESRFFEHVCYRSFCVKPNWGFPFDHPGSVTSYEALDAFFSCVHHKYERIYLVESDQVLVDMEKASRLHGKDRLTHKYPNVVWRNLTREPMIQVKTSLAFPRFLKIPLLLKELPLVTFPVWKTHGRSKVSLSLKNQWGCLEKQRYNLHPYLDQVIAEVNAHIRPAFAILDGLVGLEGDGPKTGSPHPCFLLMASHDLVALDTAATKLMGFNPDEVSHIRQAKEQGLGSMFYKLVGDAENMQYRFCEGKNNFVARVEMALRRLPFPSLFFDTTVFWFLCQGAAFYYLLWNIRRKKPSRHRLFRGLSTRG